MMLCKIRLGNFPVHQVPGTGEEEDEYDNCHDICISGHWSQSQGQDREEHNQDEECCKTDDHIKKSFVHYRKFSLFKDIGLSDFLEKSALKKNAFSLESISPYLYSRRVHTNREDEKKVSEFFDGARDSE